MDLLISYTVQNVVQAKTHFEISLLEIYKPFSFCWLLSIDITTPIKYMIWCKTQKKGKQMFLHIYQ